MHQRAVSWRWEPLTHCPTLGRLSKHFFFCPPVGCLECGVPLQSIPAAWQREGEEEGYMTSNPIEGTSHIIFISEKETLTPRGLWANSGILDSASEFRKKHSFQTHSFIQSSSYINVTKPSSGVLITVALGIREDNNFQQQLNWLWHASLVTFGAISPQVASFLGNNFTPLSPSERLQCLLANINVCLPFTVFHYIEDQLYQVNKQVGHDCSPNFSFSPKGQRAFYFTPMLDFILHISSSFWKELTKSCSIYYVHFILIVRCYNVWGQPALGIHKWMTSGTRIKRTVCT